MNVEVALGIVQLLVAITLLVTVAYWIFLRKNAKEAVRYAVTLTHSEGAFIGLCVEKHRDRWVFVDVKAVPTNPGAAVMEAAPGTLHVPYRNILYYQEIQETANATE